MEFKYGLDFLYDKEKKECVLTNKRHETMYDIELLFRISTLGKICKYRKILKLKPGETKIIKVKNPKITNVELVKYEYENVNSYISKNLPKWLSICLLIGIICFIINFSNSLNDILAGVLFVSFFPFSTVLMNAGAKYDFRQQEKSCFLAIKKHK